MSTPLERSHVWLLLSCLGGLAGPPLGAQTPAPLPAQRPPDSLEVGPDRAVKLGAPGLAAVEPYLAADPRDPNHLVGAVTLVAKMGDPRRPDFSSTLEETCATFASFDGGQTWLRHDFPVKPCFDPWVAVLPTGAAVFLGIGQELVAFRSKDGGKTWSDRPVSFGRGHDHGTLGVDRTPGPFGGSVYVVSHQGTHDASGTSRDAVFVARSSDGGATFGEPNRVILSSLPTFPDNPVMLADGGVVIPVVTYARGTMNPGRLDLTWTIASADGGTTFSAPRFLADCPGAWGQLAVDGSAGPFRDRLYWVCWDILNMEHISLYSSADRGETWSGPVIVNRGSGSHRYAAQTAAVAMNRDGVVGISWYDSRNDHRDYRSRFRCQEVFFAASLDGGQTFLPEAKVSTAENCPDTPANGETGRRFPAGGDYHGLAAGADGRFVVVWADSREGIYQLRTATVRVHGQLRAAP